VIAKTTLDNKAKQIFTDHFQKYKDLEYYSGAALSIYIPKDNIHNFYLGTTTQQANSEPIADKTLFQIGSITKSFTAAVILQLEKENQLSLNDKIADHLPQYKKWGDVTIKQILNMTSGLPNYSDTPLLNAAETKNISQAFSKEELIKFVYPQVDLNPPLKTGFFYTNTGYILSDLLVEKIAENSFQDELINRTISKANLANTFYQPQNLSSDVQNRLAHGYNYNQYDNPVLVGKDVVNNNLSWAGAAGAVISNSEDIIHWVNALFVENTILDKPQKEKLQQIISLKTGKPIAKLSEEDSHGFGLGVAAAYDKKLSGQYWFYEGSTLGFRAVYFYKPCNGVIISSIFNSATNNENNHIGLLMQDIYKLVMQMNPKLNCH